MTGGTDVLWRGEWLDSIEHFSYRQTPGTHSLRGSVLLARNGQPTTIRYEVQTDEAWEARSCRFSAIDPGGETQIEIEADRGGWWVDGKERTDLAGCTDVDLGWTPSTNTTPLRRHGLSVGESTTIRAAWVTWPDLVVRPSVQRYERTGKATYTYRSGEFTAELVLDGLGFVVTYGPDLWHTLVSTRDDGD